WRKFRGCDPRKGTDVDTDRRVNRLEAPGEERTRCCGVGDEDDSSEAAKQGQANLFVALAPQRARRYAASACNQVIDVRHSECAAADERRQCSGVGDEMTRAYDDVERRKPAHRDE